MRSLAIFLASTTSAAAHIGAPGHVHDAAGHVVHGWEMAALLLLAIALGGGWLARILWRQRRNS